MIYKVIFSDRTDFAQAKDILHLLQSYESELDGIQDMEAVIQISEDESKTIMVRNTEADENDPEMPDELSLYDLSNGDDFQILASTEY